MAWSAATAVIAAVAVLMATTATSGQVPAAPPPVKNISMVPPVYNWTALPDPKNRPYNKPEPADEAQRVYRCWGYMARGKATAEMRAYLINGTLPTSDTCDGINRLHPTCWPIMFTLVFQQVTPRQLHRLRQFCTQNGSLPPADHFDFA